MVVLLTIAQIAGHLGGGWAGDRISKRAIVVGCMLGHATALLLLAAASAYWMVVAFAMLHGLSWGTRGPLMAAIRADYFGSSAFGTISGDLVDGLHAGDDGRAARRGDPGRPDRQLPARLHGARQPRVPGLVLLPARAAAAAAGGPARPLPRSRCHPSGR